MLTIRGFHAVREALDAAPRRIRKILLAEGKLDPRTREITALARSYGIPVYREPRERLGRFGEHHQGVVAELSGFEWRDLDELLAAASKPEFFLALDQVEDPRNLGAIVRTADGAGVHGIVVPERRSAPPSEAAMAASAGALLHAPMARVTNLSDAIADLKERGLWVVGLAPSAREPWFSFDFRVPVVLVVGSEGRGLRPRVASGCDVLVSLPQRGSIESLNVSVAAGIVLYEVVRQRGDPALTT
ncbi:MAG: 23S rRNA (guanosine(2251)-2'-O)-methyltransferase RlmB [Vicinamibacteria bacterium]